jgi:uncharacterized protein (TIGR02453 family)
MAFTGFPDEAFDLYARLDTDNTRTFWRANKTIFDEAVKAPMLALLDELADHGPYHVFRPNKDVRFSKSKAPYKDHIGAYGESQGGAGFYVQLGANGMIAGSGYYQMATDQLERFRSAVDSASVGGEIAAITAALRSSGLAIAAISALKTAPRGYSKDHPRIELLRLKGLVATRQWSRAKWMHTNAVIGRVRDSWDAASAMNAWLDAHVGPSTLAPDEDDLARFGPL